MVQPTETGMFWDRAAETVPRDELGQLQALRVRECVERLKNSGIKFYERRFADAEPEEIRSTDDFRRLPFMVKEDLREHYPFGLFLLPRNELARIHASSGSTGKPTVVGYTRNDLELWADTLARGLVAGGLSSEDVFQNAYGHGLFTGGLGFHHAVSLVGAAVVPTAAGNTVRQVMLMRDFGATALGITPSYALYLAEVAVAEGANLRELPLRVVFPGAEPMTENMEREIGERMGAKVYEQYGLSEIIGPGVASACGHSEGMHVWEDRFIPEVVDPETGERLPDGEVGELVLSAPVKEAFPILRYRTRDLVRLMRGPCPCGRTSVRMSKVLGRTDDMMVVRGVNVFPSQIEAALLGVEGLEPHYQILRGTRPDGQDELRVRVEVSETIAAKRTAQRALEARVTEVLRNALDLTAVVELASPNTVPRSEGKVVRVVDLRT